MRRRHVFIPLFLVLLSYMICLTFFFEIDVEASNGYPVSNLDTGLNYTTIQAAINANETQDGHRIWVDSNRTYYEHVVVNKSISLFGHEVCTTFIDGSGTGTAITITKGNVNITGFTMQNSVRYSHAGIHLKNVSHCNITGNIVLNNYYGVHLDRSSGNTISGNHFGGCGLYVAESYSNIVVGNSVNGKPLVYLEGVSDLVVNDAGQVILVSCNNISVESLNLSYASIGVEMWKTNHTRIARNKIADNKCGIRLYGSSCNNTIMVNTVTANNWDGIRLYGSSYNNTISSNNVTDNYYGISLYAASYNNTILGNNVTNNLYGIQLYVSSNNTISENTVTKNHEYGISLYASSNNTVLGNRVTVNNWDGIRLHSSLNNIISRNTITTNHEFGIRFESSSCNNTISGNNIANNWDGIHLYVSSNNTISGNTVTANLDDGLCLRGSHCNNIAENNVTSHSIGIYLDGSLGNLICRNNFMNNFDQVASYGSANSWNGSYSCGGNYWSDYTNIDEKKGPKQDQPGSDGIWDHPYVIDENNIDHYPMVPEFSFTLIPFTFMIATLLVVIAYKRRRTMQERRVT